MNELKTIYIVYAIIALLCIIPEVIGFNGLAQQDFEYGSPYSGVRASFKIFLGFILFGIIVQVTIISSVITSLKQVNN